MIPTAILYEYEGKVVNVYTTRSTFDGVLEVKNSGLLVVLKPTDKYSIDRYGPVYIDTGSIVAIREIKPRAIDKDDCGEDDCCDESPKAMKKSEIKAKRDYLKTFQADAYFEGVDTGVASGGVDHPADKYMVVPDETAKDKK